MPKDEKTGNKYTNKVKAASAQNSPDPIVVFMVSSTPEKIRDFQLITESKGYPIIFADMHQLLGSFHYTDEVNSDFKANAADKLKSVDMEKFRSKHEKRLSNYLEKRKIPKNAKIYFAAEDSGFSLPKKYMGQIE